MISDSSSTPVRTLSAEHIEDIKLAASKMGRVDRRELQAKMAAKYCGASARRAETVFGWSRAAVQRLHRRRLAGMVGALVHRGA